MLSLNLFSTFIPDKRKDIRSLQNETGLPKDMLAVFEHFYGLKKVAIYDEGGVFSLIENALLKLQYDVSQINYLIYLHTADWVLPQGDSLLKRVQDKFGLSRCHFFEISYARCASYFIALELLSKLFKYSDCVSALILTGEIAFTPALRVVPQSSIVSDVSTAAIWLNSPGVHQLLSVVNKFIRGYEKGIYLTMDELKKFDLIYIENTVSVVKEALLKAKLSLSEITYILPHNVNLSTWRNISSALHFPIEKIYLKNIPELGHSFCSDHLINLESLILEGLLKPGDYYLMVGCGLGFTLSAAVFRF
ncbi:MAG: 3-oxoacyl-[acyl-carrier-protein] synthase III C-terminal domain-containing protein [Coxiellaceae bacterium]|nr:3-oxoacyl-[acyl-carrier-protein] synthase III C-terminal domain-containing protein [Coxiellaceae bacterium]